MKKDTSFSDNFTTYKQYKEDIESIAGWLAQHALRCGYKITTTAAQASGPLSVRLKGKARNGCQDHTAI